MKPFDPNQHQSILVPLLQELLADDTLQASYLKIIKKYPRPDGGVFSKDQLVQAYRKFAGSCGVPEFSQQLLRRIQKKPTRTISGVTPVTVLTKPFPCPGQCIFCPNDIRMPKSYLSDEPGAQRAERNWFDPYLQTYNRLQAYSNIGHPINKVEIIVLGGTWSFYPEGYQIWFIHEVFRALNEFGTQDNRAERQQWYRQTNSKIQAEGLSSLTNDPSINKKTLANHTITSSSFAAAAYNKTVSQLYTLPEKKLGFDRFQTADWDELFEQHRANETAEQRCVGLVIETRPDNISEQEVIRVRKLGCTKTQIGVQSLQDEVLAKNNRGHDVAATRKAFRLLRQTGFKIHAHWMANLYGSSVEKDKHDFDELFGDDDFHPDELKIYPCSLIESAELMQYFKQGKWQPYTRSELLDVVTHTLQHTPKYCRLTRVIRDIPSTDIVVGNKKTNFRQLATDELQRQAKSSRDIRSREIRGHDFDQDTVWFDPHTYYTTTTKEHFLQVLTTTDSGEKLLAFLRLSFPKVDSFIKELTKTAIIREVHVYGPAQNLGQKGQGQAQHLGLGKRLLSWAEELASKAGYSKIGVISAIGTRQYYRNLGFYDGELYQFKDLIPAPNVDGS